MPAAYSGMRDTSVRIDVKTRDKLAALAAPSGMTVKRLLWLLARNVKWDDVAVWQGEETARAAKQPKAKGRVLALPVADQLGQTMNRIVRKASAPRIPD